MTDAKEVRTAERFAGDTLNHQMKILHDDGLYRHIRFIDPKYSSYWFDLITWPGNLVFRGDGETFAFSRTTDMFEFFRSGLYRDGSIHINPGYWAEKLTTDRDSVMTYDQDLFEQQVKEYVVERIRDGSAPKGIGREIRRLFEWGDITHDAGAHAELADFEYEGFRFHDTWEWQFKDYDWWFLWALYGIVWGIARYDRAKGTRPSTELAIPLAHEHVPEGDWVTSTIDPEVPDFVEFCVADGYEWPCPVAKLAALPGARHEPIDWAAQDGPYAEEAPF